MKSRYKGSSTLGVCFILPSFHSDQYSILNDLKHENTKEKTPEDFYMTILPREVSEPSNKNISGLLSPGTTESVTSQVINRSIRKHETLIRHGV